MDDRLLTCWINIGSRGRGILFVLTGFLIMMLMIPLIDRPFSTQEAHTATGGASVAVGIFIMIMGFVTLCIGLCYCWNPCRID